MYEDYMQNLLGMRMNQYENTYGQMGGNSCCGYTGMTNDNQYNCCQCGYDDMALYNRGSFQDTSESLEDMYPEIYKIIYPMVRKTCMQNNRPINRELIEEMTDQIYSNIETGDIVNLNINVDNSSFENSRNSETEDSKNESNKEVRSSQNRQSRGPISDLIRILLLRELLGNRPFMRPNPPRPPMGMNRPPFGGMGPGPMRPPMMNRYYE